MGTEILAPLTIVVIFFSYIFFFRKKDFCFSVGSICECIIHTMTWKASRSSKVL